jgi:hypothetical protein
MARYSYSLQYAESDFDQVDDKGIAAPADILAAFDAFDWMGQVRTAEQLQKSAPTLSVREADGKRLFWVSAYDESGLKFVNDYSGAGSTRELSITEARRAVQLFVEGHHDALLELLTSTSQDEQSTAPAKSAEVARAEVDKAYIAARSVFEGVMITVVGTLMTAGMSYLLFADSEVPPVFTLPLTAGGLIITYVGIRILIGKIQERGMQRGRGTDAI